MSTEHSPARQKHRVTPKRRKQPAGPITCETLSIPEAGKKYFGLSRNGSYAAAEAGAIPWVAVGRLKRVPVRLMERKMESAGAGSAAA